MSDRKSSNPAFSDKVWERVTQSNLTGDVTQVATISGTVTKTFILLVCLVVSSMFFWKYVESQPLNEVLSFMLPVIIISALVQIGLTFYLIRNPVKAQGIAIAYALIEGVTLGAVSYVFELRYQGIVIQAVLGTAGVTLGMLMIYKTRIIKVTENFKIMIATATMGIAFTYLASMIAGFFGVNFGFIHDKGPMAIAFSLFVIAVASFNLVLDFDFIEKCEEEKAPSYMEWYGAFGVMLTIIWLYLEILKLLSKRRN